MPESLFNKVASLRPATLLKRRLWHGCFPVNFTEFLRRPFYRTPPDNHFSEFWIINGKCDSSKVTPVNTIVNNMDKSVVNVLPVVNALKGCDTISKAGTKSAAFQAAMKCGYELFYPFGKSEISDQMILSVEKVLVKRISKSFERNNFDDIRLEMYHQNPFQLDLEISPPTSSSIHIHIKQAFLSLVACTVCRIY